MLTRQDRTVADCLEVWEQVAPLGLRHAGFKDVGVPPETLRELARRMRAAGTTVWLEVVSTDAATMVASARVGAAIGVDRLLGGTEVAAVLAALAGTGIGYLPFPGVPEGHPTRLGGGPALVEAQCRAFMAEGCAGADLLAYRATEAAPLELVAAARRGLGGGYLVAAGSVASARQIADLRAAGADAFTVGSAVFDGSYAPHMGALTSQLRAVMADCA